MTRDEMADAVRQAERRVYGTTGNAWIEHKNLLAAAAELRKRCVWTTTEGDSTWESQCDNEFTLSGEGPLAEGMRFCCFCGGTLAERITNIAGKELP